MIHKSAIVSKKSRLGVNVEIGPFTTIHDHVVIGDNSTIEGYCEIGIPTALAKNKKTIIGSCSMVRSHSILYSGSEFGDGLVTGHRITVRENTKAGKNLKIGTLSDFQGDTEIGDYVRAHSNAHIGKKAKIG